MSDRRCVWSLCALPTSSTQDTTARLTQSALYVVSSIRGDVECVVPDLIILRRDRFSKHQSRRDEHDGPDLASSLYSCVSCAGYERGLLIIASDAQAHNDFRTLLEIFAGVCSHIHLRYTSCKLISCLNCCLKDITCETARR